MKKFLHFKQVYSRTNRAILSSLLFVFTGFQTHIAFAQHQYDNWYFGSNAGMNFTAGSPVNLTDGQINTIEGCSSISDSMGNLLFYSDGITVWNKVHVMMVNGNGLHGGESSSQSALIIQQPGSDSLYYIFTTGQSGGAFGLQYSVVDISLQGGNGEVILKNANLVNNTTEKVTAVRHSNNTDYWVITHERLNNHFDAFLFNSAGVIIPAVVSNIGTTHNNDLGYIKASHNGLKIAVAVHGDNFFELLDFDKATGTVSNPIYLTPPPSIFGPYGIEFSPNDLILYGTVYSPGILVQWDISSNNIAIINASKLSIDTSSNEIIGALQLAPDGKIYVAKYQDFYLGAINDPNVYGAGCNYSDSGFYLFPKQCKGGLPNFFSGLFNSSPAASFAASDSQSCGITCVDFTDLSTNNPTSWEWFFPGGNPSTSADQNPSGICYNSPGNYDVTLIVSNSAGTDTTVLSNFITIYNTPSVSLSQSNDTLYSTLSQNYQWYVGGNSITGATDFFYVPTQEGFYSIIITDSTGCTASDTIFFTLAPFSGFSAADTTICQKFCLDFFDQSTNNPDSWLWIFDGGSPSSSTDQNPVQVCYNVAGVYDVTLITGNSFGSDTLTMNNYITVNPTPPIPVITQNGLMLTSTPAFSYQWQFNNADIAGATDQFYSVTQTGFYNVIITDENGCTASATLYVLITGIEGEFSEPDLFIYPNPSNGSLVIESFNGLMVGQTKVEVYNMLGEMVYSSPITITNYHFIKTIDLKNLTKGVYILKVKTESAEVKKKIMIAD